MKKIIIIRSTGSELSNQLWNYASIYAHTLEKKFKLENYSFFEYGNYFTIPAPNIFLKLFFFLPFTNYTKRKKTFKRRLWRKIYEHYIKILTQGKRGSIIVSDNKKSRPFYLSPTIENELIHKLEKSTGTAYFDGWLFRNPVGIEKYRNEIHDYLRPRKDIENNIGVQIQKLRTEFKHIVGVHIRQGDYVTWRGGAYLIPPNRVRGILNEYLDFTGKNKKEVCFVITSDGSINKEVFNGLNIFVSKDNAVHDLFILASTDTIIGSNSTFGAFASYYGNIPFIVMQKNNLDWKYYRDKTAFFENKYSTFVHY